MDESKEATTVKAPRPFVVGMVGRAGSGKNFTARMFRELAAPLCVREFAFAARLKRTLATLWGDERFLDEEAKEQPFPYACEDANGEAGIRTYRWLMGDLGGWARERDPYVFLRALDELAERSRGKADVIVVTDVRYHNEADQVRRLGGILVRMCPDETLPPRGLAGHSSETEQDGIWCDLHVDHSLLPGHTANVTVPQVRELVDFVRGRLARDQMTIVAASTAAAEAP